MKTFIVAFLLFYTGTGYSGNFWEKTHGPNCGNISSITFNSQGYIFALAYEGVFRSTDNGISWTNITNNMKGVTVESLIINSNDVIFAGTTGGICTSWDNGGSWGLGIQTAALTIAISPNGYMFAGTWHDGIYRSEDNGATWNQITTMGPIDHLLVNSAGYIFASTHRNGIYRSTDNGDNWTAINNGIIPFSDGIFINCISVNDSGKIFLGSSTCIYYSTNDGNNWVQTLNGLPSYNSIN